MTSKQRPCSSRPQPSTPPQIVYSCEICGQDLHSESHMKHHVKTTHLEDTTNSTEEAAIILPLQHSGAKIRKKSEIYESHIILFGSTVGQKI